MIILCLGIFIASIPSYIWRPSSLIIFGPVCRLFRYLREKHLKKVCRRLLELRVEHLLMFNFHGDNNGRHNLPGTPMLDPITGALMVLGVGLCLWRIRQPGSFLLLAWLLLMLVPGIFSLDFEAPQSYRAIGSLPAAYLAGRGTDPWIMAGMGKILPRSGTIDCSLCH